MLKKSSKNVSKVTLKSDLDLWVCIPRFLPVEPGFCMTYFIYTCEHGKNCFSSNEWLEIFIFNMLTSKRMFWSFNSKIKTSCPAPPDYSSSIRKQVMLYESVFKSIQNVYKYIYLYDS